MLKKNLECAKYRSRSSWQVFNSLDCFHEKKVSLFPLVEPGVPQGSMSVPFVFQIIILECTNIIPLLWKWDFSWDPVFHFQQTASIVLQMFFLLFSVITWLKSILTSMKTCALRDCSRRMDSCWTTGGRGHRVCTPQQENRSLAGQAEWSPVSHRQPRLINRNCTMRTPPGLLW